MLRRLKSQVDLVVSEKKENVLFIKMTSHQDKIYRKFLNGERVKRVANGETRCFGVLQESSFDSNLILISTVYPLI